nr:putative reverse transcriptase domain-containing protein [Tanacetum cinerariifolium]
MPLKSTPLTQDAIHRMIKENVDAAIAAGRARQANVGNDARGSVPVRGKDVAPAVRAVELLRWFEKTESVFGISESAEGKKVKLDAATLQGPALTWWNAKIVTMSLETRFNKLALMCLRMVEPERVKVDAYIQGLADNLKGEVTSSKPVNLNEAIRMAYKLMEQKSQARDERILEGKKRKWESFQYENSSVPQVWEGGAQDKDAEPKGLNVVAGRFLLNNHYAFVLFDSGSDRSFMDTRFSSMLDIDPFKLGASYEAGLADGRVVSTTLF